MIDLMLAIACSSCVSLVMRWSEEKVNSETGMLTVNYLTCSICALLFCTDLGFDSASFLCGGTMGVLLVAGLVLLQFNIRRHGVILSSLYTRLGVIIPIVFAVFLFQEWPSAAQLLGIVLALMSVIFLNVRRGEKSGIGWSLILLLAANGTCDAMNKVFEAAGDPMYNGQFLLIAFSCALLFSVVRLLVFRDSLSFREALFGVMLGIPNYFSSRFLLYALQDIDAILAYPMYSVLTIIVITLLGIGIWHERVTKKTAAGMGGILLSIALMNMQ